MWLRAILKLAAVLVKRRLLRMQLLPSFTHPRNKKMTLGKDAERHVGGVGCQLFDGQMKARAYSNLKYWEGRMDVQGWRLSGVIKG